MAPGSGGVLQLVDGGSRTGKARRKPTTQWLDADAEAGEDGVDSEDPLGGGGGDAEPARPKETHEEDEEDEGTAQAAAEQKKKQASGADGDSGGSGGFDPAILRALTRRPPPAFAASRAAASAMLVAAAAATGTQHKYDPKPLSRLTELKQPAAVPPLPLPLPLPLALLALLLLLAVRCHRPQRDAHKPKRTSCRFQTSCMTKKRSPLCTSAAHVEANEHGRSKKKFIWILYTKLVVA